MADGKIALPSPDFPRSFMVPFVVDYDGLRFGKYPPGWPALLSLGVRLGAPWLVNALLAGACAWLTYRLGRRLGGAAVGLLAALLVATSPMYLLLSASLMSHALSVFLTLALTLAWLDSTSPEPAKVPPALAVAVAGLSLGLLALTRPLTAVAVGLLFGVHGVWLLQRGSPRARRAVLVIGLLGAATGSLVLVWQWALTGDALRNLYTLWWPYDRIGFGPGHGVTEAGHSLNLARINTRFSLRVGRHDLFGWPYLSWVFVPGAPGLAASRTGVAAGFGLELSARELRLLQIFVQRRGEVVTRERLLEEVWDYAGAPLTRTVDMHVAKLRKKIEDNPADPRYVVTVHGMGYKFTG